MKDHSSRVILWIYPPLLCLIRHFVPPIILPSLIFIPFSSLPRLIPFSSSVPLRHLAAGLHSERVINGFSHLISSPPLSPFIAAWPLFCLLPPSIAATLIEI